VIKIACAQRDYKGYCIEMMEEKPTSGVCLVMPLSWEKQIEEVLLVFFNCRLR